MWVPEHLIPSWVCLPNDQPVLTTIQPGESALCVLESICKTHELDPTKHYLRLKFLMENQVQFYIPKPEEDIYDLLYKEIELCSKITKVIQFDRDESCMIGYGFSISVVEEDGVQQLYITDVKAGGLAFAKGLNAGDEILQLNGKDSHSLNFSDMKAAFSQVSLALTVNTLPFVDRRQLCYLPLRRSDAAEDLYTDIFSQSQEEILDDGVGLLLESSGDSLDDDAEIFSEFDECRKVRLPQTCDSTSCFDACYVSFTATLLSFLLLKKTSYEHLLLHSLSHRLLLAHFIVLPKLCSFYSRLLIGAAV
ncbi:hypothetical protein CHARACLAT_031639 [Characodon lateralis]|uniref:PDZ domain-containing protein n=1 Tax=Characodon lateralis TaxID=208331 RepID=A0ABU7DVT8_9TELE|nr:hypothetical protein [Characodon lateralis]